MLVHRPLFESLEPKLSLTCGGNGNVYKNVHHPIPTLWEQGASWQFSKQISKFSFHLTVQVYSLLGQTEEERKAVLEGGRREAAL